MTDSHHTITSMVHHYCELFDTGDMDAFARQFEHGTWHRAGHGYEAVRSWIDDNVLTYAEGRPCTQHVTTNLSIDVDEAAGSATASSYITVFQALADFPLQPIFSGRYRDRFQRVDDRWRWLERAVVPVLYGDTSRHTRGPDRRG